MDKRLILVLSILPAFAWADCSSVTVGSYTSTRCDDGGSYSTVNVGDEQFHRYEPADLSQPTVHGTSYSIGNTTVHKFDGPTGENPYDYSRGSSTYNDGVYRYDYGWYDD